MGSFSAAAAVAGKDSSGGGKEEVQGERLQFSNGKWWVMRDLATVAIVGVSDPVWGRGSSQRAEARTGI